MRRWIPSSLAASALACAPDGAPAAMQPSSAAVDEGSSSGEPVDPGPDGATVTHAFGGTNLAAAEELETCVSWTLDNEEALYVQAVTLANTSGFHHSNWFVVPDDVYAGADGFWECSTRGYDEIGAATAGTVLFAQSTQSWVETQALGAGVVIKVPPHSRIVGGVHLLNLTPQPLATDLWLTLELLHPRLVDTVVTPMRLSFLDLQIAPRTETLHVASCSIAPFYEAYTGVPWDVKIHYALPHFHALGNHFELSVVDGDTTVESIYRLEGFDAGANGRSYDPPVDLADATGLSFACGYASDRDEPVGWGIGDQEMCVMLLLVESEVLLELTVPQATAQDDGVVTGTCLTLGAAKSPLQGPPTATEIAAPLYVPPLDPDDADLPPVPECIDADREAEPLAAATLASLRADVFAPTCTFSACHGTAAAAGLDLTATDLHAELLEHEPVTSGGMPLVVPGDPDGSWLYRVLADCSPAPADGGTASHMPLGAPVLLDDAIIASVRTWIAAGAAP